MSGACHAHPHSSSISKALDGRRGKSRISPWLGPLQKHEGKRGDYKSLRCSLMAFKQHNICVCNATHNVERSGMLLPGSLLLSPKFCIRRSPHCFMPHFLSVLYFLSTFFTVAPLFDPFSFFLVLFILIFQGKDPLLTQRHAASLCLSFFLSF